MDYKPQLTKNGYAIAPDIIGLKQIDLLIATLEEFERRSSFDAGRSSLYAMRNLLESVPAAADLAASTAIRRLVKPIIGPNCFAVRGILFDKTPGVNWKVVWHQDLSITVEKRCDTEGFGPWSVKEGTVHVQPPVAILEKMLTVRLHLDDCFADNGPVRVLPGSHRNGRLNADGILESRRSIPEISCESSAGGVLLMRPLLLHASSAAISPAHRRVIHIEYAAEELPEALEWFTRI